MELICVKVELDSPRSVAQMGGGHHVDIRPRINLLLTASTLFLGPAGNCGAGDVGPVLGTYRVVDGKVD